MAHWNLRGFGGITLNRALFRVMFKKHGSKACKIAVGIVLYEWLLTWVYPVIAENPAVTDVAESLPTAVKSVFGVPAKARVDTFEAYIAAQFFARIWTTLMALYEVNTANELISKLVQEGFLAFPLSAPLKRREILQNQMSVLLTSNALLTTATLAGLYLGVYNFNIKIDYWRYLRLAVLAMAFFTTIGAYSLFFSVIFAEKEQALGLAAGLTLFFYGMDIIGNLNEKFAWAKKLTIFRLFQPQEVLEGASDPQKPILILTGSSLLLYLLTIIVFNQKDIHV